MKQIRVKGIELVADFYDGVDPVSDAVDLLYSVNLGLERRGDGATIFYDRPLLEVTVEDIGNNGEE